MKQWLYPENPCKLSIEAQNPILAKLLAIRNIDTDEKVDMFLNPEKKDYIPFSVFKDSDKVISRIKSAIEKQEKIIVYGDFDTDGVTSTAILYKTLKLIGANVDYYLPDRDSESHGLNNAAILKLISKSKAKLIITVDCGISNANEVKIAKSFKTDVIITDHHEAPEVLPEAFAIINPKAQNVLSEETSASDIESLCYLSGAGISFKLALSLLDTYSVKDFAEQLEPIAALGTIGDIVPLLAENRRIAYCGIKAMQNEVNLGITKLFKNAGIKDLSKITSENVAFTAVPRINAVGRLEKADIAFKLLVSDDETEIDEITYKLNETNTLRQNMCDEAFHRAEKIVLEKPDLYKDAIVICDEDAHIGIIGLSASRLVEKYAKPAFVMKKDGNMFRCSCRGLQGVNIFNVLNENAELFQGFGGHEFAGGFSFDGNVVSFEKIQKAIVKSVVEQTNGKELPNILNIDMKIQPEDINVKLTETVSMLEPCGAANPTPVFAVEGVKVADVRFMGEKKNHLKLLCMTNQGKLLECVKWFTSEFDGEKNETANIAFVPSLNEFNGNISVQLMLKDVQFPNKAEKKVTEKPIGLSKVKIIDCRKQKGGYDKIADFLKKTKKTVAIFAENNNLLKECKTAGIHEEFIFNRYEIPEDIDMVILAESPFSLCFLKNLVDKGTKEILFMQYEKPNYDVDVILSKIAGMLNYVCKSKDGQVPVQSFLNALNFDAEIFFAALELLKNLDVLDYEKNNEEIIIKSFKAVSKDKIKHTKEYDNLKILYAQYCDFLNNIENLNIEDLKKYLIS